MKINAKLIGRTLFSGAAALTLGFGVLQAFATPASAAASARQCDLYWCDLECRAAGANGGKCVTRMICECW